MNCLRILNGRMGSLHYGSCRNHVGRIPDTPRACAGHQLLEALIASGRVKKPSDYLPILRVRQAARALSSLPLLVLCFLYRLGGSCEITVHDLGFQNV